MAEQVSVLYLYPEFVGGTLIIQVLIVQISHLPPQHDIVMSNDHEPYQTEQNVTGCHQDILLHANTVKIQFTMDPYLDHSVPSPSRFHLHGSQSTSILQRPSP